jgi:hypothetical protein
MQTIKNLTKHPVSIILGFLVVIWFAAILLYASRQPIPYGEDWEKYFLLGAQEVLHGRSPYNIQGFANPPWALLLYIPLSFLPPMVGATIIAVLAFITYIYLARKFCADAISTTAILLSPFLYYDLQFGNINWLVMLGLAFPPQIGLFFILLKPQVGIAIAIFWLYQSWKTKGIREVIRVFLPVTIAFGLSFLIFGMWPLKALYLIDQTTNTSLWPQSIPIGLVLVVLSLQKLDIRYAMIASPFLSPYLTIYSWIVTLYGLLPSRILVLVAVLGSWIWIVLTGQIN